MQTKKFFNINLKDIESEGEFPCPKCGSTISPDDDERSEVYDIIDVKIDENYSIEKVTVLCNKCKSLISVEGFDLLYTLKND